MRNNEEYQLYKDIALYMKYQYPNVLYRFDMAGLNLSKAQAGMNKAIQQRRGWSDLFIAEPRGEFHGLFVELKKEGESLTKKNGEPVTDHVQEQINCLNLLRCKGYYAEFAIGWDEAKKVIDWYLAS